MNFKLCLCFLKYSCIVFIFAKNESNLPMFVKWLAPNKARKMRLFFHLWPHKVINMSVWETIPAFVASVMTRRQRAKLTLSSSTRASCGRTSVPPWHCWPLSATNCRPRPRAKRPDRYRIHHATKPGRAGKKASRAWDRHRGRGASSSPCGRGGDDVILAWYSYINWWRFNLIEFTYSRT